MRFWGQPKIWEFMCWYRASCFVALSFLGFAVSISRHSGSLDSILWHLQLMLWRCDWVLVSPLRWTGKPTGNKRLIHCGFLLSKVWTSCSFFQLLITHQCLQRVFFFFFLTFYPKLIILYGKANALQARESLNILLIH